MKIQYTAEQLQAAVNLYRIEEQRLQDFRQVEDDLLSEGSYTGHEKFKRKAEYQLGLMRGMRLMAAALGISEAELLKAVSGGKSGDKKKGGNG